jgi:hypothetical protein
MSETHLARKLIDSVWGAGKTDRQMPDDKCNKQEGVIHLTRVVHDSGQVSASIARTGLASALRQQVG